MSIDNNSSRDLVIDEVTLYLLNKIGWGMSNDNKLEIVGEGIGEDGITSAYKSHRFYIKQDGRTITNYEWTCQLPLKNGGVETIATSNAQDFIVPAITDENKYEHTIDGDIRALISVSGMSNGIAVSGTYNLTLELKPRILKANVISLTHNDDYDEYFYDAIVDIYYEGSYYVYSYVEEEYSSISEEYFSEIPFYTRLNIKAIDLWGNAWINITVKNKYGSDNTVIEIPSVNDSNDEIFVNKSSRQYSSMHKAMPYNKGASNNEDKSL